MYTLYMMPGACSRAINALLRDLGQSVELVNKSRAGNFADINPSGAVPVLVDEHGVVRREGAAIILHLLEKHRSVSLPVDEDGRSNFIEWLMFANATMHPAYSKLFFIDSAVEDGAVKQQALTLAAAEIARLWRQVDGHLGRSKYVCGDALSVVDMMLAVYASWGDLFSVEIALGDHVMRMLGHVHRYPSFQAAVDAEAA